MRTTHRAAQGILGTLVLLALIVLPGSPAAAHAELKSTDPKADSTVTVPLTQVTLTFSQPVKEQLTTVAITGADGATYSDGAARAANVTVTQAVKALPQGRVSVAWRTESADGHTIQGTVRLHQHRRAAGITHRDEPITRGARSDTVRQRRRVGTAQRRVVDEHGLDRRRRQCGDLGNRRRFTPVASPVESDLNPHTHDVNVCGSAGTLKFRHVAQ